jgi:hypothetical protein
MPRSEQRFYTVLEVNALIPRLERAVVRMQRCAMSLREALQGAGASDAPSLADVIEHHPELRPLVEEIENLARDIEATGGRFKGLEMGLVDFPAEVDGEQVLLCWQLGEQEVSYYHSPDTGFAGRRPLGALPRRYLQ